MQNKIKKCIWCTCAGIAMMVCVAASGKIALSQNVSAEIETPDYYADTYNCGETFSITTKKVTYNGKEYDADVIIIAPNGNAYRMENFVAAESGLYTVEYRITVDGKSLKTTEKFTVNKKLYEVSSTRSSAKSATYTYETKDGQAVTLEGIDLTLSSGDTFYYNKIIDLSNKTAKDKILGMFSIAQKERSADLLKVKVTFTDVYDPTNYVTVEMKGMDKGTGGSGDVLHYSEYRSWMSAGAAYQQSTGIDRNNAGQFIYNGNIYYKWVQHIEYGYPYTHSFYGTPYDAGKSEFLPVGSEEMQIYWDYAERQIHGPSTTYNPTTLVADLDDSTFFNEIWQGFTTGEVTMSITGENYISTAGRLFITGINGDDLSRNVLLDNAAPNISVDTLKYSEDKLPIAKVGKPYKLYDAIAIDDYDGELEVTVNVAYNYRTNNEVTVEVRDGTFVPFTEGRYELIYTAKDKMGKIGKKTLSVDAFDNKEFTLTYTNEDEQTALLGKEVTIPDYEICNASGKADCVITAKHNAKTDIVYTVKAGKFIPMYAGEYTLEYVYSDYLESKTQTYILTVEMSDVPTILEEMGKMPQYLLKNCVYELPVINGYVFENGSPIEKETVISVTENGVNRMLPNRYFAPQTAGIVTVMYTITSSSGKSFTKSFDFNVLDVGYGERLHLEKYFIGSATVEPTQQYVEIISNKDDSMRFATALQVYNYQSSLQINTERNEFTRLTVRMQDTNNPDVSVAFHYTRSENGTLFSVNDETLTYNVRSDYFTSVLDSITFNYSNTTLCGTFDEATYVKVKTDENGNPFNGFTDNLAYVSFEVSGVKEDGAAGVRIYRINGQPFNKNIADAIKPELYIINKDSGLKKVGDRMYIAPSCAFDVLDPNVNVSFTVYDPDGKICKSEDGTLLNAEADHTKSYYVVAKKIGTYMVRYQVCDSKGNKTTDSYALNVIDKEPPEITVEAPQSTAKVGQTITLPKATATDNATADVKVRVYVYYPDGHTQEITGESFVATMAGTYKVTYLAMDELINTTFKTFVITVTK